MLWTALLPVVALPAALAFPGASHRASKRALAATDATLYAYGTNLSGIPLVYCPVDGSIYINPNNLTSLDLQPVTWDIPNIASAPTTPTVAKTLNGTSAGSMGIATGSGQFENVAIVGDPSTYTAGTTTGISVYGKQVIYFNGSSFDALFWAKPKDDYWVLAWNADNQKLDGTTPVVIKTLPPASTYN